MNLVKKQAVSCRTREVKDRRMDPGVVPVQPQPDSVLLQERAAVVDVLNLISKVVAVKYLDMSNTAARSGLYLGKIFNYGRK